MVFMYTKKDAEGCGPERIRLKERGPEMAKRIGLGKGIDGLIQQKAVAKPVTGDNSQGSGAVMLPISKVDRDKNQPRTEFDEEKLEELAESIKRYGIIEPLIVSKRGDWYEIVAGERRWRAAQKAGLKEVPAVVRDFSEQEKYEIQLVENLQREDLNPIDEAKGFKVLKERFQLTDDQIAERVSKSRTVVTNSMRLLKLDQRVQQMMIDEQLTTGHARALISVDNADKQYEMAQDAFDRRLSVREVEDLVRKLSQPKKQKKNEEDLSQYRLQYEDYANKLTDRLGVKVSVGLKDKNSGKLEIEFYNGDDFEKIYQKLSRD